MHSPMQPVLLLFPTAGAGRPEAGHGCAWLGRGLGLGLGLGLVWLAFVYNILQYLAR